MWRLGGAVRLGGKVRRNSTQYQELQVFFCGRFFRSRREVEKIPPWHPGPTTLEMEIAFSYTKQRKEFGKHCKFTDGPTEVLESILPTDAYDDNYIQRNPVVTAVDTTPHYSQTEVNTERVVTKSTSMTHTEGGWPKDVDFTEQSDVKRFRKKVEKDEDYQFAMKTLVPKVERCMKQNNTVNVYEEYFDNVETEIYSEPPYAMGLAVFRDPSQITRTATSVNWHPEGSSSGKLAVSYSVLNFQDARLNNPQLSTSVRVLLS